MWTNSELCVPWFSVEKSFNILLVRVLLVKIKDLFYVRIKFDDKYFAVSYGQKKAFEKNSKG